MITNLKLIYRLKQVGISQGQWSHFIIYNLKEKAEKRLRAPKRNLIIYQYS